MPYSTRFDRAAVVAVLIAAALALPAAPPAAADGFVVRVNDEKITEADVTRGLQAAPGANRQKILESLVEEALLVQEARRQKIEKSTAYRRTVQRWRQNKAVGLIGVDTLRRFVARTRGAEQSFSDFYPVWEKVNDSLSPAERSAVDQQVQARLDALKRQVGANIDTVAMRKYTLPMGLAPEEAEKVVAAQTSWGPITLDDLLAEEPQNIGHVAQKPSDVLKMWQQIAREIAGRNHVLHTAETAGMFKVASVKEEETRARREALRVTFLEQHFSQAITRDALIATVDREIPDWTTTYAIAVEQIRLVVPSRLEADTVAMAWRGGKPLPAGTNVESYSMALAWSRFTMDQKRVLLNQPWGAYMPSVRVGDAFVIFHLMAATPPPDARNLGELARPQLTEKIYRELLANLAKGARISRE